jgi:hypothetical protein
MKHDITGHEGSIEIGQYRAVNKGALKAFFTLVEYPTCRKTLDCRYFVQGDKRWISFPQKEFKRNDKTEFIPLVSFGDKDYEKALKAAILAALVEEEQRVPQDEEAQGTSFIW